MIQVTGTLEKELAQTILSAINSPYSVILSDMLRFNKDGELLSVTMPDPLNYEDNLAFAEDYLAYNLLRKADFLNTEVHRPTEALKSFLAAEQNCFKMNRSALRSTIQPADFHKSGLDGSDPSQSFICVLARAQKLIADVLGEFSWSKVERNVGFSGGASTRLPRRAGSPFYKYQGKPDTTRNTALLSACIIHANDNWKRKSGFSILDIEGWVNVVKGSHSTTVPKNAKTDRFICKEPDMNMYIQRGFGAYIRDRLKTVRIDLNDQTVNQNYARIGSSTGSLATIDLKAASDSISLWLVDRLIPVEWASAMKLVRSEFTFLKTKDFIGLKEHFGGRMNTSSGHWVQLEKISSMGNGFTFELESLLFWGITRAVVDLSGIQDTRVGVYGDDIICHCSVADRVIDVLKYCGFATNNDKTFVTGPFRESCGFHSFYGRDVTPFSITSVIDSEARAYWFLNNLNSWVSRCGLDPKKYLGPFRKCVTLIKKHLRMTKFNRVPLSSGDTSGFIICSAHSGAFYSFRRQAFLYKRLRPRRKQHSLNGEFAVFYALSHDKGKRSTMDFLQESLSYEFIEVGDVAWERVNAFTSSWCDVSIAFGVTESGSSFIRP